MRQLGFVLALVLMSGCAQIGSGVRGISTFVADRASNASTSTSSYSPPPLPDPNVQRVRLVN